MVWLRDLTLKGNKIPTQIFEAKYYLLGSKIILMTLCLMSLQTSNSLLAPLLESSLPRTSNFPQKLCRWHTEQDKFIPTLFCTRNCPKFH